MDLPLLYVGFTYLRIMLSGNIFLESYMHVLVHVA